MKVTSVRTIHSGENPAAGEDGKSAYCRFIEQTIDEGGFSSADEEFNYIFGMRNFAIRFRLLTNEEIDLCDDELGKSLSRWQ